MAEVIVFTDGGARGNPGPAAIGVVIVLPHHETVEKQRAIGTATNNQAEYRALLWAAQLVSGEVRPGDTVLFQLDSELVVKQMKGEYKVRDADLAAFHAQVTAVLARAAYSYRFRHIPRQQNKQADALVNAALDAPK